MLLVLVCPSALLFAGDPNEVESSVKSFDDHVKIRYMPSRSDFLEDEPITELESQSHTIVVKADGKVMSTNASVKQIYDRAKALEDKGITSNQRYFHVSTKKIEVAYMGQTVSLEYAGASDSEEYEQYEMVWLELYSFVYQFLTKDIEP